MEYHIRPDASYPTGGMNREWLLTNSLGDYASGTTAGCNTRRYHGLLAVQTPSGKYMLLSTIEDSINVQGHDVPLSTRLHPGVVYPEGWRALKEVSCNHDVVSFTFRLCGEGDNEVLLVRSLMLDRSSGRLLIRYALADTPAARELGPLRLTLRPLINGRNINHLHAAVPSRTAFVHALGIENGSYPGFSFRPEEPVPALVMQISHPTLQRSTFTASPDWYYKILYPVEKARGYDFEEDLLMPGTFVTSLAADCPIWVSAGNGTSGLEHLTDYINIVRKQDSIPLSKSPNT